MIKEIYDLVFANIVVYTECTKATYDLKNPRFSLTFQLPKFYLSRKYYLRTFNIVEAAAKALKLSITLKKKSTGD